MEQALFDNARCLRREADQEDHVDERRMVGEDDLPGTTQAFRADELVGEHAQHAHEADEPAHVDPKRGAHTPLVHAGRPWQQPHEREHQHPEEYPAQPEHRETQARGEEAPAVGKRSDHRPREIPDLLGEA